MEQESNELLRSRYIKLFDDNAEYGRPENITRKGCLALARLGADTWNCWRRDNPSRSTEFSHYFDNRADFEGVDFTQLNLSFARFDFGDGCSFATAKFGKACTFLLARFGESLDFSNTLVLGTADFTGACFGEEAIFSDTKFQVGADFTGIRTQDGIDFSDSYFGVNGAKFLAAEFKGLTSFEGGVFQKANFSSSKWHDDVSFRSSRFIQGANFNDCSWFKVANFSASQWGKRADFIANIWGSHAVFSGAQFGYIANFTGSIFHSIADFSGKSWDALKLSYQDKYQEKKQWGDDSAIAPDLFYSVDFRGCSFYGSIFYRNRTFKNTAYWSSIEVEVKYCTYQYEGSQLVVIEKSIAKGGRTQFKNVPEFHGAKIAQDTSFADAEFPQPAGDDRSERAYRTLKLAFEQHKAIREEQMFFRYEMDEEVYRLRKESRSVVDNKKIANEKKWLFQIMSIYKYFDYGFNIRKPVVFLFYFVCLVALISLIAMFFAEKISLKQEFSWVQSLQLIQYSIFSAIPFVGGDKLLDSLRTSLFGDGFVYRMMILIEFIFFKSVGILMIFLTGLSLRNRLKMK